MNLDLAFRSANNNQIKAATQHHDSSLIIIAAPGSGKTLTLILRIAYLLNKSIDPKNIFIVTFTKKAALEMKKRLYTLIPHHIKIEDLTLGTFHHCALNILRANAKKAGLSFNFSIVSGKKQKKIIEEVLTQYLNSNKFEELVDPKIKYLSEEQLQGIIEDLESEEYRESSLKLPPGSLKYVDSVIASAKISEKCLKSLTRKFFLLFDMYNTKLREKNLIDLPDILFITTKLLKNSPEVLENYRNRYKYIIVDEFQDTNQIQLEMIQMLGRNSFVTVCGDDDQAIYGWRGASNEIFSDFLRFFPDSATVLLNQNYRSSPQIVEIAQKLINHNKNRGSKEIYTENEAGPKPELIIAETVRQESAIIGKLIKNLIDEGYQYKEIAILYRLHRVCKDLIGELSKLSIPLRTKSKPVFLDKTDSGLINYLRVFSDPSDEEAFMNIVNWPKRGLGDSSKLRLKSTASVKNLSLVQALEYLVHHFSGTGNKGFTELYLILKHFQENLHLMRPSEIILKCMTRFQIETPPQILKIAEEYEGTGKKAIDELLEALDCSQDPNVITLSSIHQAKGQEWNIVFVARVNENVLPAGEDIEEERRLAYVAATRAKKKLILTCAMTGNKGEPLMPSRFVDEFFHEALKNKNCESGIPSSKKLKLE